MADRDCYIRPQRVPSQFPSNQENPSKYYTHFLYKALIASIFLVILPLLPSQAPEFINQTRSWELLQLLFVGIAVSYGLFSRKNDATEKDRSSKFDNSHTYLSRFLQVSSVFDDDSDSPSESDENKIQTWNSQYYREEPVLVAKKSSVLEEHRSTKTIVSEKPLLLPVRSLKSRVPDSDFSEKINISIGKSGSFGNSNSNSGWKHFSNKFRNGEFGDLSSLNSGDSAEENVVRRSPIPWRSRSGRKEMMGETDSVPSFSLPPPTGESEFHPLESSPSIRTQSSNSPSPKHLSPSPSFSSPKITSSTPSFRNESSQFKNIEDVARKKVYYNPTPPPAPPPPPSRALYHHHSHKTPLGKSNSIPSNAETFSGKELKRNVKSIPMDSSRKGREEMLSRGRKMEEFEEDVVAETDEESENEEGKEEEEEVPNGVSDGPPDVNKKAEEFIAKFREQIRLQRIESIKKSTGQIARN